MTVDAFLKWDDGTDTRYELVDGQVMAIPMRWAAQALLVTKLVTAIHARASPGFVVYTGCGVRLADDASNFRIPDISVAEGRQRDHWLNEPRLTCEVLMAPTATLDLDRKLAYDRSIPSVVISLILRADARRATVWRRSGDCWNVLDCTVKSALVLPHLEDSLPLDELYEPLEW